MTPRRPKDSPPVPSEDAPVASRELQQDRAILALLEEPTIRAAVPRAGVAESTLYLWLAEPAFAARLKAARRTREQQAMARLSGAAATAVETLLDVMGPTAASKQGASARVSAAKAVLEFLQRDRDADVVEEIAELRAALDDLKNEEKR